MKARIHIVKNYFFPMNLNVHAIANWLNCNHNIGGFSSEFGEWTALSRVYLIKYHSLGINC